MALNTYRWTTGNPFLSVQVQTTRFNAWMGKFLRTLSSSKGGRALARFGFELVQRIILRNPVKTGRSRAAWYIAAEKLSDALGASWRGDKFSPEQTEGYNKGSAHLQLTGYNKSITISNGVAYIWRLEYGYSTKAPWGMVRITMQQMARQMSPYWEKQLKDMWDRDKVPDWSDWRSTMAGPVSFKDMTLSRFGTQNSLGSRGSRGRGRP